MNDECEHGADFCGSDRHIPDRCIVDQSGVSRYERDQHGGDTSLAEVRFGIPESGWLDLSTGINARPYAVSEFPPDILHRLPLRCDVDAMVGAARAFYATPDTVPVVVGPGTQALIQMVPTLFAASLVSIVSPTYGEHAKSWARAGHRVQEVDDLGFETPFGVLVNPNNPDGRVWSVDAILRQAATCHAQGGVLVVDEAFGDVLPDISVASHGRQDGLVVLKSFGKFFGLAGVRLGFALCSQYLATKLNEQLGPWAVSGPALWVGHQAFEDQSWVETTRRRLHQDAIRMDALLVASGLDVVGGTDLFRLVKTERAQSLYESLGRLGILTRPFTHRPTWLRFGLPGCEVDWDRLAAGLTSTRSL